MRIGVALPHYDRGAVPVTLDAVVGVARECERLGFDSVWVSDHLVFDLAKYGGSSDPIGCLEPLSTLSVLAAETRALRLGTMVLCNEFRPPAVLAKAAATLQLASDGRLELGIGAGWYEREFDAFGLPFPPPGVRLARLGEAVEVMKLLWTGEPARYDGRHYTLRDAVMTPAVSIPVWVGGKGDRAIALAGRVGDGWNAAWFQDAEAYAERAAHLDGSTVRRSIGQYVQGSAQEQTDRLADFAGLGVELAVVCFSNVPFGLDDADAIARFASDVLPAARAL